VDDLRSIWVDTTRRQEFLQALQQVSVYVDVLAEVLGRTETDQYDLLCHLTFGSPLRARSERAAAFINRESRFLGRHQVPAREVILALLEKYRAVGIDEISDPRVFRLSPFFEMGQAPGVTRRFGSLSKLQRSLTELQKRIYA
jgi:type I restriction enzyme R subunit